MIAKGYTVSPLGYTVPIALTVQPIRFSLYCIVLRSILKEDSAFFRFLWFEPSLTIFCQIMGNWGQLMAIYVLTLNVKPHLNDISVLEMNIFRRIKT